MYIRVLKRNEINRAGIMSRKDERRVEAGSWHSYVKMEGKSQEETSILKQNLAVRRQFIAR